MNKQTITVSHIFIALLHFICLASCQNSGRLYSHPTAKQPHATMECTKAIVTPANLPSVRIVEINGKPPAPVSVGFMQKAYSFYIHPGDVHLFVEGNTGLGVTATAHLDFKAREGGVYRLDQAIGMTEIAFMITESGKRIASTSGSKTVSGSQQNNSTPMFIPIVVR